MFASLVDMLIERRDKVYGIGEHQQKLSRTQKWFVLRQMAYEMATHGNSSRLPATWLRNVFERMSHRGQLFAPTQVMDSFIERCAVIKEAGSGKLEFIHNSFKKFLAALHALHERDTDLLISHIEDPEWSGYLMFACAQGVESYSDIILRAIYDRFCHPKANGRTVDRRAIAGLFLQAASVSSRIPTDLEEAFATVKQFLIPPKTPEEALGLAQIGDEVCDYLGFEEREESEAISCIYTLGLIGSSQSKKQLLTYRDDPRQRVRAELARYINPLYILEFANKVIAGEPLPIELANNVDNIDPLAGIGKTIERLNLSNCYITSCAGFGFLTDTLKELSLERCPISDGFRFILLPKPA